MLIPWGLEERYFVDRWDGVCETCDTFAEAAECASAGMNGPEDYAGFLVVPFAANKSTVAYAVFPKPFASEMFKIGKRKQSWDRILEKLPANFTVDRDALRKFA